MRKVLALELEPHHPGHSIHRAAEVLEHRGATGGVAGLHSTVLKQRVVPDPRPNRSGLDRRFTPRFPNHRGKS